MCEMGSLWSYEEDNEMEKLGHKLLLTTLELEKLKSEAVEEICKNRDHINHLTQLLEFALQERDQAKVRLDSFLNNTNSTITEFDRGSSNGASVGPFEFDLGSLVIDDLVKGRVLPQKGKFLQSVIRAGPLLQTLLVAGPLPRWRNPPQFRPFKLPAPVSVIGGCNQAELGLPNVGQLGRGTGFDCTGKRALGSSNGPYVMSGMDCSVGSYASLGKRQRFC